MAIIQGIKINGNYLQHYAVLATSDILQKFLPLINQQECLEIFIHNNQAVRDIPSTLRRGTAVTFEILRTYHHDRGIHTYDAINLRLLFEETDAALIERCVKSENENLWRPLLNSYLVGLSTIDAQASLVLDKIQKLPSEKQKIIANLLPKKILSLTHELRKLLENEKRIEILV